MHRSGIVTFLFTDIQGSTRLWQAHPKAMPEALARHHCVVRAAVEAHRGDVFQIVGDAFCVAFPTAMDAVAAALDAQRALHQEAWGETGPLPVRMGLHTGNAESRDEDVTSGRYASNLTLTRTQRIMSVAWGGQVLVSHATRELVHDQLPPDARLRDLGEHRLKDLSRAERIFQLVAPGVRNDFPPLATGGARPDNLPAQLTSFVGRDREMAQIESLLAQSRLVTLTGSGGAGKSRLALQAATKLLDDVSDGVWLVELAPLSDASFLPQAVASAIGIGAEPGRPLIDTLRDHLRPKRALLVLDNCEHLVGACAQLADDLLHVCPDLTILATSREPLDIAGETAFRVPSLAVPESVRLFVERASAVKAGFEVTSANAAVIEQICRRLDGIPLAIELAAVRLKMFTIDQIFARLDDRFRLLTGGSRTALPRQQTLHALIDWSHELLSPPERVALRRLSIFAGGWTFDAAEAVCAADTIGQQDVLELLAQLVNKSLVVSEESTDGARYSMLETVRQYARERLEQSEKVSAVGARHLQYFLGLAKEAEPQLLRADQVRWLDRLDRELANIRTALAWSLANDRIDAGMGLASELWRFWQMRGLIAEGREWLRKLLAKVDTASDAARAQALYQAGFLALMDGDRSQAVASASESLPLCRRLRDKWGTALSLVILGAMAGPTHREQAEASLAEGVALFREIDDQWRLGQALMYVAALREGHLDFERAAAPRQENLALFRMLGDRRGLGFSLLAMATAAMTRGDNDHAARLATESLANFEAADDRQGLASTLRVLGRLKAEQEKFDDAIELLTRSVTLFHRAGSRTRVAFALEEIANVAMARMQWRRAAILYAATAALLESSQANRLPAAVTEHERRLTILRSRLDPTVFDAAWTEGRGMTMEQAIHLASSDDAP